jgi:dTDP-4-amino-4,6-dideoxygalactose transaminase
MEPYRSNNPENSKTLAETEKVAARVIVLPTGQQLQKLDIKKICQIIRSS